MENEAEVPAYAASVTGRSARVISAYSCNASTAAIAASAKSHQPPA